MTDAEPAPAAPPLRTWRPMILWTAGILLALGIAWFVGAVVVPVWRTKSAIAECATQLQTVPMIFDAPSGKPAVWNRALDRLGGRERAPDKLVLYLRMPESIAPNKKLAVTLLWWCGESSLPALVWATEHQRGDARVEAIMAISRLGGKGCPAVPSLVSGANDPDWRIRKATAWAFACTKDARAVPALILMLGDGNFDVRDNAAFALGEMGSTAGEAVPALTAMLKDASPELRSRAAEALAKIRVNKPGR